MQSTPHNHSLQSNPRAWQFAGDGLNEGIMKSKQWSERGGWA